jgi:hypothetical protein
VVLLELTVLKKEGLMTERCTERLMLIQNAEVCRVLVVLWRQNCWTEINITEKIDSKWK